MNFTGHSHIHDFWVNADHPFLLRPIQRKRNSRTLRPTKDYNDDFNWISYLQMNRFVPTLELNFSSTTFDVSKTTNLLCIYSTESLKLVKTMLHFCVIK